MSIVAPLSTGQQPETVTRSSTPITPLSTGQQPATVTRSPPLTPPPAQPTPIPTDTQTAPQQINQNGTSGTLVNTST
jgi:hypothetical protein